jgi:hypothetical protein
MKAKRARIRANLRLGRIAVTLGVTIAVIAVAPALGGPSLKKLVKKEVAKQIAKATGPQGPPGTTGANGADGTARAYARVVAQTSVSCSPDCDTSNSKGISNVTRLGTGDYCVHAPGIDAREVAAVTSVEFSSTSAPEGNASAIATGNCDTTGFQVVTQPIPTTGTPAAAAADNVGFTIVIP